MEAIFAAAIFVSLATLTTTATVALGGRGLHTHEHISDRVRTDHDKIEKEDTICTGITEALSEEMPGD